jgi:hypothetical protein
MMRAALCISQVALIGVVSCAREAVPVDFSAPDEAFSQRLPAPARRENFIAGVALGLHFEQTGRSYESYLWEIAALGASHVSLVVQWEVDSIRSNDVHRSRLHTVSDDDLRRVIRDARRLGLDITLFPIIWVRDRDEGEWRGVMNPPDVNAFWTSYSSFIAHYADLSEEEGVDVFSVGSELGSLEVFTPQWRDLIADVRQRAPDAELTYSANWDHFQFPRFWPDLDYIGVTGYYEVAPVAGEDAAVDVMVNQWHPILDRLAAEALANERPVLITEVGYVSQAGAASHPWDYTLNGEVSLDSQLDAYEALYLAINGRSDIAGVVFWNWFGDGGSTDNGYTPRLKPAGQLLRWWFTDWTE